MRNKNGNLWADTSPAAHVREWMSLGTLKSRLKSVKFSSLTKSIQDAVREDGYRDSVAMVGGSPKKEASSLKSL